MICIIKIHYGIAITKRCCLRIIVLVVILILSIIFITSRVLTRYLTRSITDPLELLTVGFYKIREGDLQYQIQYTKQDEFLPVSKDFNGMARQLKRNDG